MAWVYLSRYVLGMPITKSYLLVQAAGNLVRFATCTIVEYLEII